MVTVSETDERAFEKFIEKALIGSTREERGEDADIDAQHPAPTQYYWGSPKDLDKKMALDTRRLMSFLHISQQEELDKYVGGNMETEIPKQIARRIDTEGVISVLRGVVEVNNIKLKLFFPKPSASDSEASKLKYAKNQFSLTRQQTFSVERPDLEIDMVLYVNGLPLFTFELKNPWTHQTARYNGQKQYKSAERSPKEPLLKYGHCLAHFTVDKNDVFFTTRLALDKTYFMPFNRGLANGQGAGNPVNPNGFKTSYLWEHVLQKDTVADIIQSYVLFDYGEVQKDGSLKKVPHTMRNALKLIFPRFHQLDVVSKLVADVEQVGVGKTYLIQHSAGSGKSNSLTWLAFKLIGLCPATMEANRAKALDQKLFNSVIVVTDRRLLDNQITGNIRAFVQGEKLVAHASTSAELQAAIETGKRIIITTIQKFPYICNTIGDVSDHNFAIIIDEAHSSQSGIAADKMNATTQKDEDQSKVDTDALLMQLTKDRKMSTNCSYFAFTATPKKETLERFGTKDEEGKYHPFHLYSMKQAIDEGFILDVLTNYTTYKGYYELKKSIADNPQYNNEKAQKLLRRTVERDPKTIEAKAEEMLTHFDTKVFRSHKLNSKAKAMVVTKDIECAIMYYQALTRLASKKNLTYKILIAFSGEKRIGGKDYTEADLNGFPDAKTADEFDKDDYRILVVANKYLTGFDQKKLCAMYIDKPLDGVLAVQALSRLNRSAPELGKRAEDLFILDFYNTMESMKDAFDPFYTATTLSEATDVNILHQLRSTILDMGVFGVDDVNAFIDLYLHGADSAEWAPIMDAAAERFKKEIDWPENGQADFKMKCKQFVKVYSRVAAIMEYEVLDWEKLFWFLRFLIPELKLENKEKDELKDLLDSVDLSTYGLRRTALNETIKLDSDETELEPAKPTMVGAGGKGENTDPLDEILKQFNERWFKGWQATPEEQRAKLVSIAKAVADDAEYNTLVVGNTNPQTSWDKEKKIINRVIRQKHKGDMTFYRQWQMSEGAKAFIHSAINQMLNNLSYL